MHAVISEKMNLSRNHNQQQKFFLQLRTHLAYNLLLKKFHKNNNSFVLSLIMHCLRLFNIVWKLLTVQLLYVVTVHAIGSRTQFDPSQLRTSEIHETIIGCNEQQFVNIFKGIRNYRSNWRRNPDLSEKEHRARLAQITESL